MYGSYNTISRCWLLIGSSGCLVSAHPPIIASFPKKEKRRLADHYGEEMKCHCSWNGIAPWLDYNTHTHIHTLVLYESLNLCVWWGGGVSSRILPFLEPLPLLAIWSCCTASLRDGLHSAHFLSPSCLCSILSPPAQADTHSWMVQQTLACCWERRVSSGLRLR